MSTQFTPGPWTYVKRGTQIWATSVGGCTMEMSHHLIADVRGWGHLQYLPNGADVQDANARLIAAAPDLLEALQEAQVALGMMPSYHGQRQQDYADAAQTRAQDAYDIVIEAIAKALGEKND